MKRTGYLVLTGMGRPMILGRYDNGPLILINGNEATVFETYDAARCAIRRTCRYALQMGFDWGDYKSKKILRVEWAGD